jgi:microcystin-dependent protein
MANYPGVRDFTAGNTLTADQLDEIWTALQALFPVGCYMYFLTASTSVETFIYQAWLECNGASVLRATYPDLNTLLSSLSYPFGTADGSHFTLPDLRGRTPWSSGPHANTGLGDSDGVAAASRQPKHTHTIGSISVGNESAHTHSYQKETYGAFAAGPGAVNSVNTTPDGTTGAGSAHSHSLSGNAGSGMNGSDAVAHLVAGTYFIKAVT